MPRSKPSPLARQSSFSSSSSSSKGTTEPRRRNSFASATASSLAHGGPATMAPKMIHHRASRKRIPSVANDNNTDKENCDNETPRKDKTSEDTPNKFKGSAKGTPGKSSRSSNPILSPVPYWKVLAERDGETSPRLTRSASKKRMSENMRELDDLDVSREENAVAGILNSGLRFASPSAFCASARGNYSADNTNIGGWNEHREKELRLRQERMLGVDDSRFGMGRAKKKAKTVDARETQSDSTTAARAPSMNPEELRSVMIECLAMDHDAKLHAAIEDKAEWKSKYAELESRYATLQNEVEERVADAENKGRHEMERQLEEERNKWNDERERLEAKCLEQREQIVRYVEEISAVETKYDKSNESSKWEAKWKEQRTQLQEVMSELSRVQDERSEMKIRWESLSKELKDVKEQLLKVNIQKAELERVVADDSAVAELQRKLSELREEHTHLQKNMEAASDTVLQKSELAQTLESTVEQLEKEKVSALKQLNETALRAKELEQHLETARQDLESAREELSVVSSKLDSAQSPRSRSALEEQHQKEVSMLSNRISTLENRLNVKESELQDIIQENTGMKEELGQFKVENEELATVLEERERQLNDAELKAANNEVELEERLEMVKIELQEASDEKDKCNEILKELAHENEGLLAKLEGTQHDLLRTHEEVARSSKRVGQLENELTAETKAREQVNEQLVFVQNQVSELQVQISSLQQELCSSQELVMTLQHHKLNSEQSITQLSNDLSTVKSHLQHAKSEIASLESQLEAKQHYCNKFENIERELLRENHVLNEIRRKLHNRVIQLSGNIRVFVRVRPMIESETLLLTDGQTGNNGTGSRPSSSNGINGRPSSRGSMPSSRLSSTKPTSKSSEALTYVSPFHFPAITADRSSNGKGPNGVTSYSDLTKQTIEITEPYRDRGGLNPRQKKWKYGFDRVYNPTNTQDDIWEGASPLVQSCIDGFHVCMFAYGQTGSGKTFTMIGDAQHPGIIPRSVQMFFNTKDDIERKCKGQGQDVNVSIAVELLEIYNEEVRDLLSPDAGTNGKLVKVDLNGHEAVGNVIASASSQKDVEDILKLAQSRRCVKATKSNAESSRSHLLFTIHFQMASTTNTELNRSGCLHIIDLAGSERVDKSGSQGALLTEAKHINKSLSALTGVIEKLQAKSEHIPYRDSKLTYLLRNSLGGDSKTLAIVCCSPQQEHFQESHNSIRFAAKASKVELKEGNKVDI